MTTRSISVRIGIAAALAALFGTFGAAPAFAHDGLTSSSPTADATVSTELTSVDLGFSNDFIQLGSYSPAFAIQITGPDGRFYNTDCVVLAPSAISTSAALGESGTYSVLWQVISSDGHPTSDTFTFTYVKPDTVTAAEGSPIGATCADDPAAAVNQTPLPTASETADAPLPDQGTTTASEPTAATGSDSGILLSVAIGGALVVVAAAVAALLVQRRRARGRP